MQRRRELGFNLIELMMAVAIVGVLAALAVPAYSNYQLKSTRTTGTQCLLSTQARLESAFARTNKYPASLTAAGLPSDPAPCGDGSSYTVTLTVGAAGCPVATCYQLTANPVGSQADDGTLRLTTNVAEPNPSKRNLREHLPPGGSTWLASWDFTPGS